MDSDAAAERLLVIRTLMERSAIYRRALAPVMLYLGLLGIIASVVGVLLPMSSATHFGLYWMGISLAGLFGAFVLVRRQALRDKEPFWSPPTRRVAQALLPALIAGAIIGVILIYLINNQPGATWALPICWILLYGCALHAAGFFMPRGIKMLGWLYILGGGSLTLSSLSVSAVLPWNGSHVIMAAFFGGLQLFYGAYLYFTEKPVRKT